MKKIRQLFFCSVFTLLSVSISFGQNESTKLPIDPETNKITYSEVVLVDSITTKQELYLNAKEWFVHAFNSAQNVIQFDDKESGKIIGKGLISVGSTLGPVKSSDNLGVVSFVVEIQLKNGKYRYNFTDLWHDAQNSIYSPGDLRLEKPGGGLGSMGQKNWNGIKIQTDDHIKAMIKSLKISMKSTNKNTDNW